ncbi:hypothetical protein GCM10027020_01700 [Nocardioides salsibiostraticola]
MDELWYASYGSNMDADRLACYVAGGTPTGARRSYAGARDRTLPTRSRPVDLAGSVYFAWQSPTWGGGVAFYDPERPGSSAGRAYRLTLGQFSDVAAQEMGRAPGTDLDLSDLLTDGVHALGPGRYETLHVVGEIDDLPVVTFTAAWTADEVPYNAPTAAYLATMARGLRSGHQWDDDQCIDYLLGCDGIGAWTRDDLRTALADVVS